MGRLYNKDKVFFTGHPLVVYGVKTVYKHFLMVAKKALTVVKGYNFLKTRFSNHTSKDYKLSLYINILSYILINLYANSVLQKEQCREPGQKKTCCVNSLYSVLLPKFFFKIKTQ